VARTTGHEVARIDQHGAGFASFTSATSTCSDRARCSLKRRFARQPVKS
jgi:hypothetical protein